MRWERVGQRRVGRGGRCGGRQWGAESALWLPAAPPDRPAAPQGAPVGERGGERSGARGMRAREAGRLGGARFERRGREQPSAPPACVSQRRVTGRAFSPGRRIREQPERTTVLRCRCGGQREVTAPVGRCSDREKLGWSLFRRCRSGWSPLSHPIPGNPGVVCGLSDQPLLRGRNSVQPRA